MRVAVISSGAYETPPRAYGGGEMMTWLVARTLGEMGHEIHLFACGGSQVPPGGQLHYIRGAYGQSDHGGEFEAWDTYRDLICECDVVHDWSLSGIAAERTFLEAPELPYLHTYNGIAFAYPRCGQRNATVPSEETRQRALDGYGAWWGVEGVKAQEWPGRLREAKVVPWGTDCEWYTPGAEDRLQVAGLKSGAEALEPGYLLYVGRPHFAKGVSLVLMLAEQHPEEHFVFAWRPTTPDHREWEQKFRQLSDQLENVDVITLPEMNHHEVKRSLYRGAGLFFSPSIYCESFGLTGVEAMACGTPAVLGANGAGPEILSDPEAGTVVNAHRGQEIALADLERALAEYRGGRFKRQAARTTAERYDARGITRQYLGLYEQVMGGEAW